jgi:hypothetical protein
MRLKNEYFKPKNWINIPLRQFKDQISNLFEQNRLEDSEDIDFAQNGSCKIENILTANFWPIPLTFLNSSGNNVFLPG